MNLWWSVDAAISRVVKWGLYVSMFCVFVMMIMATIDIITTKFFNFPIPSTMEIIESLNVPLVFMGMAFVQLQRGHLSGPVFENVFPKGVNKALKLAGYVLGIAVCSFISWRALPVLLEMIATGASKVGATRFPLWPLALITLLGFAFLAIAFILSSVRLVALPEKNSSEAEEIEID